MSKNTILEFALFICNVYKSWNTTRFWGKVNVTVGIKEQGNTGKAWLILILILIRRVRPSLVTQQPPPPYYPSSGLENKALEHSLDLALDEPAKSPVYASQNGYGYHGNPPQGHNINGGECKWLRDGFFPCFCMSSDYLGWRVIFMSISSVPCSILCGT